MFKPEDKLATKQTLHRGKYPTSAHKIHTIVKQVFMGDNNSIIVWFRDANMKRQYLSVLEGDKQDMRYIGSQIGVAQISAKTLLIVNKTNGQLSRFHKNSNDQTWKVSVLLPRNNIIMNSYTAYIFIFSQTSTLCLFERSKYCFQQFTFYKYADQDKLKIKKMEVFIIDDHCQEIIQLNEVSKMGCIDHETQIFSVLDHTNKKHFMRRYSIVGQQIRYIYQINEGKFIFMNKNSQYWILNSERQHFKDFITFLQPEIDNQHRQIFKHNTYSFRIFGNFMVIQKQSKFFKLMIDSKINVRILNHKQDIYLCLKLNTILHGYTHLPPHLCLTIQDESTQKELTFRVTWYMSEMPVYVHMLLHIYSQFDDDLIQDAVEMLLQ